MVSIRLNMFSVIKHDTLCRKWVHYRSMLRSDDKLADILASVNRIPPEQSIGESQIDEPHILNGDQQYRHFLVALKELNPETRTVFILSCYEGLAYSQIANTLDISVRDVQGHMIKALDLIRDSIKVQE